MVCSSIGVCRCCCSRVFLQMTFSRKACESPMARCSGMSLPTASGSGREPRRPGSFGFGTARRPDRLDQISESGHDDCRPRQHGLGAPHWAATEHALLLSSRDDSRCGPGRFVPDTAFARGLPRPGNESARAFQLQLSVRIVRESEAGQRNRPETSRL